MVTVFLLFGVDLGTLNTGLNTELGALLHW